jgi:hypothetical protein
MIYIYIETGECLWGEYLGYSDERAFSHSVARPIAEATMEKAANEIGETLEASDRAFEFAVVLALLLNPVVLPGRPLMLFPGMPLIPVMLRMSPAVPGKPERLLGVPGPEPGAAGAVQFIKGD